MLGDAAAAEVVLAAQAHRVLVDAQADGTEQLVLEAARHGAGGSGEWGLRCRGRGAAESAALSGAAPRGGCGNQAGRGWSRNFRRGKGGSPGGGNARRGCEVETTQDASPGRWSRGSGVIRSDGCWREGPRVSEERRSRQGGCREGAV